MGVMLVYDITNLQTFLSASSVWLGDSYLLRLLLRLVLHRLV